VDNIFFGGRGFTFVYPGQPDWRGQQYPPTEYKPPFFLRLMGKAMKFALKRMLGVESIPPRGADLYHQISLSQKEANIGGEKKIQYKRGKEKKKVVVKVPAGVREGTKIRLRGMGQKGEIPGDLYVTVRIKN